MEKFMKKERLKIGSSNPARTNIKAIAEMEERALHSRSRMDVAADFITRASGSFQVIFLHGVWFALWILINLNLVPGLEPFDPFPFGLLTMIVSLEAIFLSLFVLLSQNRMNKQADRRAHLDLQVDMLAEQEMTVVLHMLHALCSHFKLKVVDTVEVKELLEMTDISKLARELEKKLPSEK
jgi:uncharacterized membrane protein